MCVTHQAAQRPVHVPLARHGQPLRGEAGQGHVGPLAEPRGSRQLRPAPDGERVEVVVGDQSLHGEVVAGGGAQLPRLHPEPGLPGLEGELEVCGDVLHVRVDLLLGDGVEGGGDVLGEADMLEHHAERLAHEEGVGVEVGEARGLVTYQRHLATQAPTIVMPPCLLPGHLGELHVAGGEGHTDGPLEAEGGPGPVQVVIHHGHVAAQLPAHSTRLTSHIVYRRHLTRGLNCTIFIYAKIIALK